MIQFTDEEIQRQRANRADELESTLREVRELVDVMADSPNEAVRLYAQDFNLILP